MGITRKEAKEIVDWVLSEVYKRRFPYITDGKIDLTKTISAPISGTQTYGGSIADGAIWNRHIADGADIDGTKVKVATTSEQGVVTLGTEGEALVPTMSGLLSTDNGLGASLIGVEDAEGDFVGTDVESVLHEILTIMTFLALTDTPSQYVANWKQKGWATVINEAEDGLEFKPIHYFDGGDFSETYEGAVVLHDAVADGESFTENNILDGGSI